MIQRGDITGLVLAGGRGERMGGADKGLQPLRGVPLALHALRRLAPQVSRCLVSANRNLPAYAAFGVPVVTDGLPDHPGPLGGVLAGLQAAGTDWLLTVPCDTPAFPLDLAERMGAEAACSGADIVLAASRTCDGGVQRQPVFCLVRRTLEPALARFVEAGGRGLNHWATTLGAAVAAFDTPEAFTNANTLEELQRLH